MVNYPWVSLNEAKKNHALKEYGQEEGNMTEEKQEEVPEGFKEATSGDVVKFENPGDNITGELISVEPSRQFEKSFAVRLKQAEGIKTVFVSAIVVDLLTANQVKPGMTVKIEYLGKAKTKDGAREYNDYKVYFK